MHDCAWRRRASPNAPLVPAVVCPRKVTPALGERHRLAAAATAWPSCGWRPREGLAACASERSSRMIQRHHRHLRWRPPTTASFVSEAIGRAGGGRRRWTPPQWASRSPRSAASGPRTVLVATSRCRSSAARGRGCGTAATASRRRCGWRAGGRAPCAACRPRHHPAAVGAVLP